MVSKRWADDIQQQNGTITRKAVGLLWTRESQNRELWMLFSLFFGWGFNSNDEDIDDI